MKKLHFDIVIHASRVAVWEAMLAPDTYRQWTAEFAAGSYYEGRWAEGERIRFLVPKGDGMFSLVAACRPHEFLSLKHLGEIKGGVEDPDSEASRSWANAFENYSFADAGSATRLDIDVDAAPEFEDFMTRVWPKALGKLKAICEAGSAKAR